MKILMLMVIASGWALQYPYIDDSWIYKAALIVSGEAPGGCHECYNLTACQIVYEASIRNPWIVVSDYGRWHGRKEPNQLHIEAVQRALDGNCDKYPVCDFLGNTRDLTYFRKRYPIESVTGFCSEHGCSLCIVTEKVKAPIKITAVVHRHGYE